VKERDFFIAAKYDNLSKAINDTLPVRSRRRQPRDEHFDHA
jgi:hypothetical protein